MFKSVLSLTQFRAVLKYFKHFQTFYKQADHMLVQTNKVVHNKVKYSENAIISYYWTNPSEKEHCD